jgi:Tol biopolymer transport system component
VHRGRATALALAAVALALGAGASAADGPPRLVVLTSGGEVSEAIQWIGPTKIAFQSFGDVDLSGVTKGSIRKIDEGTLWPHAVSPDRSRLAYTTFASGASVRTARIADGSSEEIVSYADRGQPDLVLWRADGKRLAYRNAYAGGEIDTVSSRGGTPAVAIPAGPFLRRVVAYSAAGDLVVQETDERGRHGRLLAVREDGTRRVLANDAYDAAASPDGGTIAYVSKRGTGYAIPARGGRSTSLRATGNTLFARIAFSPNGKSVAIAGEDRSQHFRGFVARVDGSRAVRLPYQTRSLGWSPDGRRLVFDGWNGRPANAVLGTIDPDGTHATVLLRFPCLDPTYSPDGKRIACLDFQGSVGRAQLAVVTPASG